ncbi:MAG: efflux RND transporter permease subunit [Planctomycetota bacterium]
MLLALLVLAGVDAVSRSARSLFPAVAFPRIAVIAEIGEAPVTGVMIALTRPIEQAVAAVPGLARVRSKTVRGASELSLDFDPRTDMREALSLVRARVASANLPPETQVIIERQTPSLFPVFSFNVLPSEADANDPVARARLAEWVELDVAPRLARLADAFQVSVQSGDTREYVFEADPLALAQAGLDLTAIEDALSAANRVEAVGRASTEGLQYQLLVDGRLRTVAELEAVAVVRDGAAPLRLAELGKVVEATVERTMIVTGGGRDGVVVNLFLREGGLVTRLSTEARAILTEVTAQLPTGVRMEPVYDQAGLVNASIEGVQDAIALGALLSVIVIALFIGSWRITLVAGLAIPLSVLLTIAVFPLLGQSLDLMSLGGLAVAIGLVIDDAIVVVENVARRRAQRPDATLFEAVAHGAGEVVGAIVGSSLTTVVVFLPLVLLEGVVGQFFRSLSLALGLSIVMSMFVSLIFSPLMLLLPGLAPRANVAPRRWMEALQRGYGRAVERLCGHPGLVACALVVTLLVGGTALPGLQTGFLPEMDEGGFVLDYTLPVGTSLAETDANCRRIEAVLRETPEVVSFSRRTGAELGFFATEQFTGDFLVGLTDRSARARTVFEVMDGLRERFARELPQAEVEFVQIMQDTIADLAGNPEPIEVKLLGADYATLQECADRVEAALEHVPGLVDVANHVSFGSPELTWRPYPDRAALAGLTTASIAREVGAQRLGHVATAVQERDRFVDVRVRLAPRWASDERADAPGPAVFLRPAAQDALSAFGGANGDAATVPLSALATFTRALAENELERENQVPLVRVTAAVSGRDLGAVAQDVERVVSGVPRDASIRVELGGQVASQGRAFENLLVVFGLGIGLVFLLLVTQFRSIRLSLVLFLALPFGLLGGLLALRLTGVALNISSGMGLIMLVGLVVKNGIILIEYAQELRREGRAERDAVIEAARVRLRPILMTTCAAIAGLAPLALGVGAGAELQRPLAIAVIGGLSVSAAFSLVVVPLGCIFLARGSLVPDQHALSR